MTDKQQPFKMPPPFHVYGTPSYHASRVPVYSADQMQAAYEQGRRDMREEAAKACERRKTVMAKHADKIERENGRTDALFFTRGVESASGRCAATIRNLKDTTK